MSAFVCNDPKASSEETGEESVQRPDGDTCKWIKKGVGQRDGLGVDKRISKLGSLVDSCDNQRIICTNDSSELLAVECNEARTHMTPT